MAYNNQNQDLHDLSDEELFQIADNAWRGENADDETAYRYASVLAERDHAGGLNILGVLHAVAGVRKDLKKAQYFFTRSAVLGNHVAQNNLADMYAGQYGEVINLPLAEYWYTQAAEQGSAYACYSLGWLYKHDERFLHDAKKAFAWFEKGASFGDKECAFEAGLCCLNGDGTERNDSKGAEYMKEAAEKGNPTAQYNIGQLLRQGRGIQKNYREAISWYKKAAGSGYADAMYQMGYMYENGYGVRTDFEEALSWYRRAKEHGNENAEAGIKRLQELHRSGSQIPSHGFKSTIGSLKDQQPRATDNLYIDLALCVDLTPVMPGLMSSVKRQIKELPKKIEEECANKGMGTPVIRARLVVFKDCHRDSDALRITDFYTLPSEKTSFESAVDSLEANGASVYRSGLEAIMYAMCSKWEERKPNRQVVIVWAKGDTRQISVGYEASKNMPKSFYQLSQYWGKNGSPSAIMNSESKRLILLTPSETEWNKIASNWDNTLHIPCRAGEGIQMNSRKFEEVVSFIVR